MNDNTSPPLTDQTIDTISSAVHETLPPYATARETARAVVGHLDRTHHGPVDDATIREVFLRKGFTIETGQTDLMPYVYAAAHELLAHLAQAPRTESPREARLRVAMRMLEREGPLPGMISTFEVNFGQTWTDPEWRQEASVWAAAWRAARCSECPHSQA